MRRRSPPLLAAAAMAWVGAVLVAAALVGAAGCGSMLIVDSDRPLPVGSPLRPAAPSPDAVRMEIYWATLPPSAEVDDQAELWRFVQEERLDEALRIALRRNGFRAGVVGGVPSREVVRLLNPAPAVADDAAAQDQGAKLTAPTGVKKTERSVRPGEPILLDASGLVARTTLLLNESDGPVGEPFEQARAVYRLEVDPQPGGGHTVSLAPEVHHGQPRMRYVADGAAIQYPKPMQEERAFPSMRIEASLVVGEMLLVTSRGDYSDSSLGAFFHRADGEVSGERKAIVVRLVQAPLPAGFAAAARDPDRPEF
ncbi:hypothetical protein [Botrimarina sp.]|uniref:hypothetical protein n=1 Tax=Botrimarina sp. TaxID=2795802 RepID=UPI0032EE7E73